MGRAMVPAIGLLAFSLVWTGGLTAWPREGKPVAAIYPPGFSGDAAFRGVVASGAEAVYGIGAARTIVVARSDKPGFVADLYASGALLVLRAPEAGECIR